MGRSFATPSGAHLPCSYTKLLRTHSGAAAAAAAAAVFSSDAGKEKKKRGNLRSGRKFDWKTGGVNEKRKERRASYLNRLITYSKIGLADRWRRREGVPLPPVQLALRTQTNPLSFQLLLRPCRHAPVATKEQVATGGILKDKKERDSVCLSMQRITSMRYFIRTEEEEE